MIENVIMALIYIGLVMLALILIKWALEQFGISIPDQAMKIIMVIAVLVCILILVRVLLPTMGFRGIGNNDSPRLVPGMHYTCQCLPV